MTFQVEFPDFPAADMPAIPEGFKDSSWHNDACPSIISDSLHLSIFIDFANPAEREFPDTDRFIVLQLDPEGCLTGDMPLVATDNWADVIAHIEYQKRQLGLAPIIIS